MYFFQYFYPNHFFYYITWNYVTFPFMFPKDGSNTLKYLNTSTKGCCQEIDLVVVLSIVFEIITIWFI